VQSLIEEFYVTFTSELVENSSGLSAHCIILVRQIALQLVEFLVLGLIGIAELALFLLLRISDGMTKTKWVARVDRIALRESI